MTKAHLVCRPDWLPLGQRRCPRYWLVRQMCSLTFHTRVKWSRLIHTRHFSVLCNYLCSVEFQRSHHLKALFTRIRTVLKPCIFLLGFVWTGLNKPLDRSWERLQKDSFWWANSEGLFAEEKNCGFKMSGFVWTGNNSIPEYFSISILIL